MTDLLRGITKAELEEMNLYLLAVVARLEYHMEETKNLVSSAASIPMHRGGPNDAWVTCPGCRRSIPPNVPYDASTFPHRPDCAIRQAQQWLEQGDKRNADTVARTVIAERQVDMASVE